MKTLLSFKVERVIASTGFAYEVMLSPFKNWEEVVKYIEKYRHYYPKEEQVYKVSFPEKVVEVP